MLSELSHYQALVADRYIIKEKIGAGGMGVIWAAMPYHDPSQDVAIKFIPRSIGISAEGVLRIQKEAALMARLHHPSIICFHELGVYGQRGAAGWDGYYMVMEIGAGRTLKESIKGGRDLDFFFQVALQVTSALDYTHGKNIIHRDIKPQNIMTGDTYPDRGFLVKVLDFGVARLAEATHEGSLQSPSEVAGTPMYMAPEQTGLFDGPIDHRADLYSLGCVFYEILTGGPLFTESSREKLMARHAKAAPEPLRNRRPDIPGSIEEIVMKLLAKDPAERYQTAFGLYADLQRSRMQVRSRKLKTRFPLGLKDSFKAVSAQLKLFGREVAYQELIEGYISINSPTARSHMTVITGDPGMGKSRLLAEFRSYLSKGNVRFINISFSRHENNLPYNALSNGFNEYLVRLLKGQPHEAEELKRKLRTVLGQTAAYVAEKVPGLKLFLDDSIDSDYESTDHYGIDEEDPAQTFSNFAKAFSDFTRCLGTGNQPVVFVLDDLHWADEKSLALVEEFFQHNNSQRFYSVISYRPMEGENFRNLSRFITKFKRLRRRYRQVHMTPLRRNDIRDLAGHMIDSPQSISEDFVGFIENRTGGNPLFVVELIRTLVGKEWVNYNSTKHLWEYDTQRLYSESIMLESVDLTTNRISNYDQDTRRTLEVASVIGMSFPFELLHFDKSGESVKAVKKSLRQATSEGLLVQRKEEDASPLGPYYTFIHPKAREAILDAIPIDQRKMLHLKVAKRIESVVKNPDSGVIISLVHHFNHAFDSRSEHSSEIRGKVVAYNIQAARAAVEAGSLDQADRYLKIALDTIMSNRSAHNREIIVVLEMLGDIAQERATGNSAKEAVEYYSRVMKMKLDRLHFAKISLKINSIDIYRGKLSDAWNRIQSNIEDLGMQVPEFDTVKVAWSKFKLIPDLLPFFGKKSTLYRLCQKAARVDSRSHPKFAGLSLYHEAQTLLLKENPSLALLYHEKIYELCQKRDASSEVILRTVADRAFLLGHCRAIETAYDILDDVQVVAKNLNLRHVRGYIMLYRTLLLDSYNGKYEDLDIVVREAVKSLTAGSAGNIHTAYGKLFLATREFFRGKNSSLKESVKSISRRHEIHWRNWINPRIYSIYFFFLYLEGNKQAVVKEAEGYLKGLRKVGFRKRDIFVRVVAALQSASTGQERTARKAYKKIAYAWLFPAKVADTSYKVGFLYPCEEDFMGLFVAIFPELYVKEHGQEIISEEDYKTVFRALEKKFGHRHMSRRPVSKLIKARAAHLLQSSGAHKLYDLAIRTAKATEDDLVGIIGYYWFGHLLLQTRFEKSNHVERARVRANSLGFRTIVEMCEQTLRAYNLSYQPFDANEEQDVSPSKSLKMSKFNLDGYAYLHDFFVKRGIAAFEPTLDNKVESLAKNINFREIYIVSNVDDDGVSRVVFNKTDVKKGAEVISYVSPYLNLKSSLYLPVFDSPWYQGLVGAQDPKNNESTVSYVQPAGTDFTVVVNSDVGDQYSGVAVSSTGGKETQLLNVILPLPYENKNAGVAFLEAVSLPGGPSPELREQLDYLGCQIGMLISAHRKPEEQLCAKFGVFRLEPCSWLKVWSSGTLRRDREATWYLGVNIGSSDYLLVYLRINGHESSRVLLSNAIWYHIFTLRSLIVSCNKIVPNLTEIKEEVAKILNGVDILSKLENFSLSLSLFNREKGMVFSGHFGRSRPLVINAENQVSPDSDMIFNLNSGRSVRYWAVRSELGAGRFFILPHDSSRIDSISKEGASEAKLTGDPAFDLRKLLEKQLIEDNIPRYYVAAYLESHEMDKTLPRAT